MVRVDTLGVYPFDLIGFLDMLHVHMSSESSNQARSVVETLLMDMNIRRPVW